MELEACPGTHTTIRWHRDTRYYTAILHQDLFGQWTVTRVWGRRASPMGGLKVDPYPTFEDAYAALEHLASRRAARGYVIVSGTQRFTRE